MMAPLDTDSFISWVVKRSNRPLRPDVSESSSTRVHMRDVYFLPEQRRGAFDCRLQPTHEAGGDCAVDYLVVCG